MKSRGIVYTGLSHEGAVILKQAVRQFMVDMPNDPIQYLKNFIDNIKQRVKTAISTMNPENLIPFLDRKRNTRGNVVCKSICERYPKIKDNDYLMVLYEPGYAASESAVPYEIIKQNPRRMINLDCNRIAETLISKFKKIFTGIIDKDQRKNVNQMTQFSR